MGLFCPMELKAGVKLSISLPVKLPAGENKRHVACTTCWLGSPLFMKIIIKKIKKSVLPNFLT